MMEGSYEEENSQDIKKNDAKIISREAISISYGVDIFATELERKVESLRKAGVGDAKILATLRRDLSNDGAIFGRFKDTIKRGIISATLQGYWRGQYSVYGHKLKYKWVRVSSMLPCHECSIRKDLRLLYSSWKLIGLPSTGICDNDHKCYNQLIPEHIPIDDIVFI